MAMIRWVSGDACTVGGQGNWTTEGCKMISANESTGVNCKRNHLPNFAILVDINARINEPNLTSALKGLSIAGAAISMVGMVLLVFALLGFKKFRNRDATKFHAQLCIAIFLKLLIFLVGIERTENAAVCTLMSVLIQYFTLASVMWMWAEAVLMFQKLIIVFGRITTTHIVTMTLVCWLSPLLMVNIALATLGTGTNHLISLNENGGGFCFISNLGVFFGVFLGPIFAILIFNTVVFILVIRILLKHSRKKIGAKGSKNCKIIFRILISIAFIMLLFGFHWIFGALTISTASIAFQWLFAIIDTLQGFFLFVMLFIIGQDGRKAWIKFLTCGKYTEVRIVCLGTNLQAGVESNASLKHRATGPTYITSHGKSNSILRSTGRGNVHTSQSTDGKDLELSKVNNDL